MSGTAAPADDGKRASDNSHSPPITPALKAEIPKLNSTIAKKVREVIDRKGRRA
jgi:hypothetical protein